MNKVLALVAPKPENPLPDATEQEIRDLADAIARGEVKSLVVAWETEGCYHTMRPSSYKDCLVLSTLLQQRAVNAMFE